MSLYTVADALAKLCNSTTVCPFNKGAVCPIEAELLAAHDFLRYTAHPATACTMVTMPLWYNHLVNAAKEELQPVQISDNPLK